MTPAAPVVDERQKALDRYKERLLKHRCVQRRGGVPSWADLAVHACVPAPAGPPPRVPHSTCAPPLPAAPCREGRPRAASAGTDPGPAHAGAVGCHRPASPGPALQAGLAVIARAAQRCFFLNF